LGRASTPPASLCWSARQTQQRLPCDAALSRRAAAGAGGGDSGGALSVVGGVLLLDALALPPPAKKAGGWTVRRVTPHADEPQPAPWPDPTGKDAAPPAPVLVSFQVPENLVVPFARAGAAPNSSRSSGRASGGEQDADGAGGEGDAQWQPPGTPVPAAEREHQQASPPTQQQQLPRPSPRVGWWDEAARRWSEEGIRCGQGD
jgi:hypothetical protein